MMTLILRTSQTGPPQPLRTERIPRARGAGNALKQLIPEQVDVESVHRTVAVHVSARAAVQPCEDVIEQRNRIQPINGGIVVEVAVATISVAIEVGIHRTSAGYVPIIDAKIGRVRRAVGIHVGAVCEDPVVSKVYDAVKGVEA